MEAMVFFESKEYNMNSLSKSGMTRIWAMLMECLISVKSF
jgi:hypothetical protein